MKWVRCAFCGIPGNRDRHPRCTWCGREFDVSQTAPSCDMPEVEREAGGDLRKSSALLLALAACGLVGVWAMLGAALPATLRVLSVAVVAVMACFGILLGVRKEEPAFGAAGRILLRLLAGVGVLVLAGIAAVIGLFILLFVTCLAGMHRW